ncbi:hypothetical protein HUU61_11745 [Rhodopseudomonas palustris]|uniref:Uncharacterized protein n=1 Tax=Thiospirillum jenense TaxID=1653858 RepID=A0A839HGU3_9GAMM|nr:hypothetical protein [Rhodopseudomonas palustris]MBB1126318.1 hypothetical protein [Thiospirillum jenense]
MIATTAFAHAAKTSAINPATPAPARFAVRDGGIVDHWRNAAPVQFRGIGYSPYLRGESPVLHTPLPNDGRYATHLRQVLDLNANYLHVFPQRMPPAFFAALDAADLLYGQDMWVKQQADDFLDAATQADILAKIRATIDHTYAVGRPDRLVLFSIGDELNPRAIAQTDRLHPQVHDFTGKHLRVTGRTPTEIALAQLIDAAMEYELTRYGQRHLYCHTSFTHVGPLVRPDLDVPPASALLPDLADLVCLNVYTYARGVVTSPRGAVTGTSYQGYLDELTAITNKPIFITQVGFSTSPYEPKPWVPGFGGHRVADVPNKLRAVWQDIHTAKHHERIIGVAVFELHDEWWKSGDTLDDPQIRFDGDPEEWFGLYALDNKMRLIPKGAIADAVREIFGR